MEAAADSGDSDSNDSIQDELRQFVFLIRSIFCYQVTICGVDNLLPVHRGKCMASVREWSRDRFSGALVWAGIKTDVELKCSSGCSSVQF